MKKILFIYFLLLPLGLLAQGVEDDDMIQVTGNFKFVNFSGEVIDGPDVIYYEVKDKAIAHEAAEKLQRVLDNKAWTDSEQEEAFNRIKDEYGLKDRCTKTFKKNALSSMALLFVAVDNRAFKVLDIKKGQQEYADVVWQMHQIKDVVKEVKARAQEIAISTVEDAEDGYERFRIRMKQPAGTAREDTRLIIQAYAVDCQTDDTLAYLPALVYEGEEYHNLQNKRMGFDYKKNDKLAPYYCNNVVLRADKDFELDTVLVWKRPEGQEDRTFRGPFVYSFEDRTHPYLREEAEGTCLRVKPFKLLDFSAALHDIPLTEEFHEEAGATFKKMRQNIDLRFEKGTARLVVDSLNEVQKQRFIEEMASYGYDLVDMTIEGGASPEGSLKRNEELAQQRAQVAAQMLQGRVRIRPKVSYKTHTWGDVVADLRQAKKELQAMQVEELVQGGGDDVAIFNRIKALPCYTFDIEPILDNQRNMVCHYRYQTSRPMTPTECVATYYDRKKDYLDRKLHLTAGDFYNLYAQIQDTLELDTVTTIAYREIVNEEDYAVMNPIAPYVCNRMAMMQMKRGLPDVEILRPFINFQRHGKDGKGGIDVDQYVAGRGKLIRINRHEIVANQAACYYMEQKVDTALWLIDWLRNAQADVEGLSRLEHLIKLKKLHFNKKRSEVDELEYQMAKNAVLDMSEENRAILYTEIEEWGQRPNAMEYVNRMADDSPKKWYLKGELAALNHEKELPLTGEGTEGLEDIPPYLAYFQHCFDLDPKHTYFRYYHQEAMVDETLRKKYKYKLKNQDLYRKLFVLLQQRDTTAATATRQSKEGDVMWAPAVAMLPVAVAPSDTTRYGEDDIVGLEGGKPMERRQAVNHVVSGYDAIQDVMADRFIPLGETYSRKKWLRNVFLQGGVGIEKIQDPVADFHTSALMHGQFGVGKEFSRLHALRLMMHGDFGFRNDDNFFAKIGARLDHVFDVTSYLLGYNPTRPMSVSSILGVGAQYSRGGGQATSVEGHLGAQLRFYTGPKTYLTVEPYVGIGGDQMDISEQRNWRKYDVFYGVNVNLVYYLGNNLSPESRMRLIEGRHYRNTLSSDSLVAAWQQPWFVMFSNGITMMTSPHLGAGKTMGSELTLTLGKWLSPVIGLRGNIFSRTNTWMQTTATVGSGSNKTEYTVNHNNYSVGARLDAMLNPLGFLHSYSWDTPFGFYLVASAEAGWIRKSQNGGNIDTHHTLGWGGGINMWYQMAPGLKVFLEPRYMCDVYRTSKDGSSDTKRHYDRYGTLNIGLSMELRDHERFYPHSYEDEFVNDLLRRVCVGLAGGTHFMQTQRSYSEGNKAGWNGLFFGEYHFTRLLSARLGAELLHMSKDVPARNGMVTNNYTLFMLTPGAQIDLSYLSVDYHQLRFRAYAFAGPSMYWVKNRGTSFGAHLGVKLQCAVSRHVAIALIPTAYMMGNTELPGIQFTKLKLMESINLGAQYTF